MKYHHVATCLMVIYPDVHPTIPQDPTATSTGRTPSDLLRQLRLRLAAAAAWAAGRDGPWSGDGGRWRPATPWFGPQ